MTARPPTLSVAEASDLLGICSRTAYEVIRRDEFPVPVLRLGRTIRIPTAPLLELLGIEDDPRVTYLRAERDELRQRWLDAKDPDAAKGD